MTQIKQIIIDSIGQKQGFEEIVRIVSDKLGVDMGNKDQLAELGYKVASALRAAKLSGDIIDDGDNYSRAIKI